MKKKRVFISGGSGVIGQELVKLLEKKGYLIFVGDLKPKPKQFSKDTLYYQGDLNYVDKNILKDFKPEIFIHLAATFERSTETYQFWNENYNHNVNLSHYLMDIMKELNSLKRVIFASSYLVYDPKLYLSKKIINKNSSLVENDNLNPRNLTGMAKLSHENELEFLSKFKNKKFTSASARIFRGYGKDSRDIISRWIRSLIRDESIQLYGKEGKFDFIYSKDTAKGISKLIENYKISGPINLGTGKARSIFEVIKILKVHFKNMKIREKDINIPFENSEANIDKFIKRLKWSPDYSLEKAIPEIIKFEKSKKITKDDSNIYNILITSSSKKIPLIEACITATKKFDEKINVICGDSNSEAISKYAFSHFWKMPSISDKNLQKIINGCKKRNITMVIPTRDDELYFWSSNIKKLKKHNIDVLISPGRTIKVCNDKLLFSDFFEDKNVFVINTKKQINHIKRTKYYVAKERFGAASRSIGIKLNRDDAVEFSKQLNFPVFQPFIDGDEISIDAWFSNKFKLIGFNMRKRKVVIEGESKVTTSYKNKAVEKKLKLFFDKLVFRGPIVVQAIIKKNKVFIIECNPRFGGASTASIATGLDIFYWTILEMLGLSANKIKYTPIKNKVTQIRVSKDILFL